MIHDSGSIVIGWLTKLAATIALFGLLAFDGIALATATFNATDHANTAASTAAEVYKSTRDLQAAYNAALLEVVEDNETVEATTFRVGPDGHVTLRLHREAATVWMQRIGPLKKFVDVKATGEGSPSQ